MDVSQFRHEYFLFADDNLVFTLNRRPSISDFLYFSRVLDIPLDRIFFKYNRCYHCKFVYESDLPF